MDWWIGVRAGLFHKAESIFQSWKEVNARERRSLLSGKGLLLRKNRGNHISAECGVRSSEVEIEN